MYAEAEIFTLQNLSYCPGLIINASIMKAGPICFGNLKENILPYPKPKLFQGQFLHLPVAVVPTFMSHLSLSRLAGFSFSLRSCVLVKPGSHVIERALGASGHAACRLLSAAGLGSALWQSFP